MGTLPGLGAAIVWAGAHSPAVATDLGGAASSGSTTSTISMTTMAAIPAGATVIVGVTERTTAAAGSVSDGTNTYSLITSVAAFSTFSVRLYYAYNVAGLSSGSAITYTGASSTAHGIVAMMATGLSPGDPLDTAVTASATSSVTSGSPGRPGTLLVAIAGTSSNTKNGSASDATNGWTATTYVGSSTSFYAEIGGGYQFAGTAKTFAPAAPFTTWGLVVAGFKPS